jgi:hypothetical protein
VASTDPQTAAEHFLASEAPAHRAVRVWVRELWNAAEAIAPEGDAPTPAQAVLHRDAVARVLKDLEPASFWVGRDQLKQALSQHDTQASAELLRNAHRVFLAELEGPLLAAHQARIRRWLGAGLAMFTCAVVALAVIALVQWVREPPDLAKGKKWTQSSKWNDCHPDKGECGGLPMKVFFHTNEQEQPWFQWDLEKPTTFSGLTIVNRSDSALMRAVPMIVEVSDDGKNYREILKRTEYFVTWEPRFPPVTARYLRLRIPRFSWLHLEAVKVHP